MSNFTPSENNSSTNSSKTSINLNGINIDGQNLSPETRQMLADKLSRLQNNPMISMFLGGNSGISKILQQLNQNTPSNSKTIIDQTPTSTENPSSQSLSDSNTSISFNQTNSQNTSTPIPNINTSYSRNVYSTPTFNPDVQHDERRNTFIIMILLGVGFYLLYTYVWHGQIPF